MKKIILSVALMLTAVMTAQGVPGFGISISESCLNTEVTATAGVVNRQTEIGEWYFVINKTGAFFKSNGGQTLTVTVPASSGVYISQQVNVGNVAGAITVGFRYLSNGAYGSASTNAIVCEPIIEPTPTVVEPIPTVFSVNRGKAKGKRK